MKEGERLGRWEKTDDRRRMTEGRGQKMEERR
jgi:hypothetical protein